jgi:hypothetical protein
VDVDLIVFASSLKDFDGRDELSASSIAPNRYMLNFIA